MKMREGKRERETKSWIENGRERKGVIERERERETMGREHTYRVISTNGYLFFQCNQKYIIKGEKRVSNVRMLCVECMRRVTRLEC